MNSIKYFIRCFIVYRNFNSSIINSLRGAISLYKLANDLSTFKNESKKKTMNNILGKR
jgi:hypothetical protein